MVQDSVPELVSLQISPWSLKARWALKHHGIKYRTTPYTPPFGEYALRWRLKKLTARITVPVMFTPEGQVLQESLDIAKWADQCKCKTRLGAEPLFPPGREAEVQKWNDRADQLLFYGRAQMTKTALASKDLRRVLVPPALRKVLPEWLADRLVLMAMRRLAAKYNAESSKTSLEQAQQALTDLVAALKASGGRYILDDQFSYADIAMASAMQIIKSAGPPYTKSLAGSFNVVPELSSQFQEVEAWRDRMFQEHFPLEPSERT